MTFTDLAYGLTDDLAQVPWWAWLAFVVMVLGRFFIPDGTDNRSTKGL